MVEVVHIARFDRMELAAEVPTRIEVFVLCQECELPIQSDDGRTCPLCGEVLADSGPSWIYAGSS